MHIIICKVYHHHQTVPEPPVIVGVVATYVGSTDGLLASTDIHFTEVVNNVINFNLLKFNIFHFARNYTFLLCTSIF